MCERAYLIKAAVDDMHRDGGDPVDVAENVIGLEEKIVGEEMGLDLCERERELGVAEFARVVVLGDYRPQRKPIAELAKDAVVKLVTQSKLPASWAKVDASGSDLRPKEGKPQWVVTFENPQIKNASKRKLYVTMTGTGEFVSASHKPV